MSSNMMTSSNGNIFRVTGHLCGEFTGHRWIPRTKARDAELWCFLWSAPEWRLSKQSRGWWFETRSRPLWRHCNGAIFRWSHTIQNYRFDLVYYASYHVLQCEISYWTDPFLSKRAFLDTPIRCDISNCNVINVQTVIPVNIKSTEEFYENGKYSIFGVGT